MVEELVAKPMPYVMAASTFRYLGAVLVVFVWAWENVSDTCPISGWHP